MPRKPIKANFAPDSINILIVDDELSIQNLLRMKISNEGYRCMTASNGQEAIEKLITEPIDIVITDINMPGVSGVELMQYAKKNLLNIDFIVMTGYVEDFSYEHIIEEGASDFIYKRSVNELMLRLKRVVRERLLLQDRNNAISELNNTHKELQSAYIDTINRLVIAAEYKDEDTGDHIIRMSRYSEHLAKKIGLSNEEVINIRYASPMHDIGKIGIPDSILLKSDKLTGPEFDIIKSHTIIGAKILIESNAKVLQTAYEIALTHHEKWNGKGYPNGLKKEQIPIAGRIVGIADVFDALTSNRPYKKAYPVEVACEIIKKERENHFDPELVDSFLGHIDEIIDIKNSVGNIDALTIDDFKWSERDRQKGMNESIPLSFHSG